jgi:hypothetical protein
MSSEFGALQPATLQTYRLPLTVGNTGGIEQSLDLTFLHDTINGA